MQVSNDGSDPVYMFLEKCKDYARFNGKKMYDDRFKRYVFAVNEITFCLEYKVLTDYMTRKPIEKYDDDIKRMTSSFNECVDEYSRNKTSRRMVALNTDKYNEVFPCFTQFQFISQFDGKITMIVTQRSMDAKKMNDDFTLFAWFAKEFSFMTDTKIDHISVNVANFHIDAEK
jgi:hypothetical protein